MASPFDEPEDIIKRVTSAERIEASILGVTLHFAEGHKVFLDGEAIDAVRNILYKIERKAIENLRAEAQRTY